MKEAFIKIRVYLWVYLIIVTISIILYLFNEDQKAYALIGFFSLLFSFPLGRFIFYATKAILEKISGQLLMIGDISPLVLVWGLISSNLFFAYWTVCGAFLGHHDMSFVGNLYSSWILWRGFFLIPNVLLIFLLIVGVFDRNQKKRRRSVK